MKAGWEVKPLGAVAEVISGQSPKGANCNAKGKGTPFFQGKKEFGERFIGEPTAWTTQVTRLAKANDILMSVRAPVGPVNLASQDLCIGRGLAAIRPLGTVDTDFLFYCLLSKQDEIEGNEGAVFASINRKQIEAIHVPVPPRHEQRRIVAILDEAFEGIAAAKANVEAALCKQRDILEGALHAQFNQSLEGWVTRPLGEVVQIIGGSQPPKSAFLSAPRKDTVRLIQIRDYKSDKYKVYIPRAAARRFCSSDDVMIGRYGPPLFQILRGLEGAYNVALMKAVPDETQITKDYLFYFLRNPAILSYVVFHSERAAGQIGINKETLEPYPIRYPKIEEQIRIVTNLRMLEELSGNTCKVVLRKLAALDELKASLLHQAFTGQL